MSKLLTRLAMLLVGLFIAGGLAFGATQAFASSSVMICDLQEELGTCPGEFPAAPHERLRGRRNASILVFWN